MNCIDVTTQAELDTALAQSGDPCIHLKGDGDFTASGSATVRAYDSATVTASGSATVRAYGSATVTAYGSATVTASGSATVTAYGSATVTASDSATVRASDSATVRASDSATVTASDSATVTASDSATVTASDSATVTAYDSATVTASDSATVRAYDSATVRAYDSVTVRAYDSATVTAYDSATVTASKFTAIHKLSPNATITGAGHVITPPNLDGADAATWLSYHGIEPDDNGTVTLYKAVDDRWTTSRGADYSPGATPEAADWRADNQCGGGLHVSPTPVHAMAYHTDATRFAACPVLVDEISVIDQQKVKVRRVMAPGCSPVDIDGLSLEADTETNQ